MQSHRAVNAVIYDRDGKVLLQKRDNHDVYDPGLWDFVGGMVELGETLEGALERKILEELGCKVSCVEGELFRADQGTHNILNVAYLVRIDLADDNLFPGEGKEYGWFALDELVEMPLSPLVYRNISFLLRTLVKIDTEIEKKLEMALLAFCELRKKNDRVFYAKATPAMLSRQSLMLMKELAAYRQLPFFRVCLHATDTELVHEMLMVHTCPQSIGTLKQNKTSLSYHMLDGMAEVRLYNEVGESFWRGRIESHRDFVACSIRLDATIFRSIQTLSPYSIFLEVASGPFEDNDTIWLNTRH